MATTQNTFNGNGSNLGPFSFTFKWLESTDIKVSVGGVLKTVGTHYNLQGLNYTTKTGGQVLFTTGNAPPVGTNNIRIYRDTDDEALSAVFSSGSAIRAKDLNDNFTQNLYVTQEVRERYLDRQSGEMETTYVPTTSTSLITKGYMETNYGIIDEVGFTRWRQTATAAQTTFTGSGSYGGVLSYVPTKEQVYLNGALQQRDADYTANNGSSITFNVALTVGDVVDVVCVNNLTASTVSNASNISYSGQFTGQSTRTVAAKLADVVSVKDFGAVGDGVADDTAAIQAALASSAKSILVPAGRYRITGNLNRSGHTYLYGETMTSSILQMEGTSSFVYTGGTAGDEYNTSQLQLERLSFECPTYAAKAVIDASWTGGSGGTSKTVIIRDCEITGTNPAGGFVQAIKLTNARNVVIESVRILGDRDAAPIISGAGVAIFGASDPVEIILDKVQVYFCTTGIDIHGPCEGVYVTNCTVIACHNGIIASSAGVEPLIVVTASHFNTDYRGINTVNYLQQIIQGNLFYSQNVDGSSIGYTCIDVTNGGNPIESIVVNNILQNFITGIPVNGIFFNSINTGTTESIISNNLISLFDAGVILSATTSNATVQGNRFISCSTNIIDSGINNKISEFGTFEQTNAAGITQVVSENKSSANNTTKSAGFLLKGRDTVNNSKEVAAIRCLPQDSDWVNATTVVYGRNADALAPYAFYGINGSPEGVITAPVGAIATRRDGGASTTFYVKQSGTGNTGWVAK